MIWNPNKESMSRDEMSDLQGKRLHKLVNYVYHNCAFYRERLQKLDLAPDDIRTVEDITKLPFTTKQDLRDTYPTGIFSAPLAACVRVHASSGTTGNPTIVGYTRKDLEIWSETMTRGLAAWGISSQDIVSNSYGYGLFTGGLGMHYGVEKLGATIIPTGTGNTEKHIRMLLDLGVTVLTCTPSFALYLNEKLDALGIDRQRIKLRVGGFGGEPWTESMRREIETKLRIKAYNVYGLSEIIGPGVSCECECQDGSHVWEDHYLPEIIHPDTGEPLPADGRTGELVLTTLTKEGMPLLRYRTKDLTALRAEPCACGRTAVRMSRIIGRSDDMLIIRGINVFPSQVESVILSLKELQPHYLLTVDRVNNLDTMEIRVEVREGFYSDEIGQLNALRKRLAEQIKSVLSISVDVKLVEPGSIERSQGKALRVIDRRVLK